jgi:hypothetical protein
MFAGGTLQRSGGIPDLIVAQNANQNGFLIYSLDKHFGLLRDIVQIALFTAI